MIRPALLALLLLAVVPASLRAQTVVPQARVRVMAPALGGGWISGTVAKVDSAALWMRVPPADATLRVPAELMQRLEASRGRGGATLEGAVVGGTLGALFGFLALRVGEDDDASCARGCGGASGGGFVIGAGAGTVLGALIGSRIRTGPERWREVPLPLL